MESNSSKKHKMEQAKKTIIGEKKGGKENWKMEENKT